MPGDAPPRVQRSRDDLKIRVPAAASYLPPDSQHMRISVVGQLMARQLPTKTAAMPLRCGI
jgi:hypothetical protein